MAAPLLELATQQRDTAITAEADARQALANARTALTQAAADRDEVIAELAVLDRELAAIRAALATVETPADGEPLLDQLGEKTVAHRARQAELLESERTVAAAASAESRAAAGLRIARDLLKLAESTLKTTGDEDARRTACRDSLTVEPLSTLRSDAFNALNTVPENEPFTIARARIESDIPAALITRARQRRAAAGRHSSSASASVAAAQDLSDARLSHQFRHAESALRNYVTQGRAGFDRASALLARVANPAVSPITAEQAGRINDGTVVTAGTAAAAAEKTRDDARAELETKQSALDQAILAAKSADIDADPNADADVQTLTAETDAALSALDAAESAYTAGMRTDLDVWEASVPDETWRLLDEFEEAAALLNELADTDPSSLTANLDAAELAHADGMRAEDKTAKTQRFLKEEIAAREASAAFERNAAGRRRFQATRGDS
ncbi:MAG: hypothetical protein IH602_19705 [Bryobacteraceae bacterium]|nr:hypothetical protein [Bryobacteraceae bacterium]